MLWHQGGDAIPVLESARACRRHETGNCALGHMPVLPVPVVQGNSASSQSVLVAVMMSLLSMFVSWVL